MIRCSRTPIQPRCRKAGASSKNYNSGFASIDGRTRFGHFFMNSAIVTVASALSARSSPSLLAAYAVSRVKFFGANFWFGCIIMTMMIPAQVMVVPQYIILKKLHLNDTLLAMIAAVGIRRCVLRLFDRAVHARHPPRAGRGRHARRLLQDRRRCSRFWCPLYSPPSSRRPSSRSTGSGRTSSSR